MSADNVLPGFTEHDKDLKNHPMVKVIEPPLYIQRFLGRSLQAMGRRSPQGVRVLDVGCGRGDTVAWLVAHEWDAYGIDVSSAYLERGRGYLRQAGADPDRLRLLGEELRYPFDDAYFDLVLSDQVIEHVPDLDAFCREVSRVSAHDGIGLHIYPAKWRPIEVHMMTPFAHWLPKGPARRAAVTGSLCLGLAAPYFKGHPLRDRAEIFARFSEAETFYRPITQTIAAFGRYGLDCDVVASSRDKVSFHVPRLPRALIPPSGWLYRHAFSVVLRTTKTSAP
jgi:SAM-dependent methyltransferase